MGVRSFSMRARAAAVIVSLAVATILLIVVPAAQGDDECGYTESASAGADCARAQMTLAVVWVTHKRIIQAPNSAWPDSTYLLGMLNVAPEFHNYINFASFSRTNLDVRVIKRRGADSVYAWVALDSVATTSCDERIIAEIKNKINAGQANPSDSTFFKNADGVFYYFGRLTTGAPGVMLRSFCVTSGCAYGLLGGINGAGQYGFTPNAGSTEVYWQRVLVHEVGHMFGFNHQPQGGNGTEAQSCHGCIGCFGIMDGFLGFGCPKGIGYGYVPYHPFHLQQVGWADFVPISRDTTLYVRDIRIRPLIYTMTPKAGYNDTYAMVNLQHTSYDSVVAGEGLEVTHGEDHEANGWQASDIWDIEIPQKMFVRAAGSTCPTIPHVDNSIVGVDTLQCAYRGDNSYLWPWPDSVTSVLGPANNPSTALYVTAAAAPYDSQAVASNLLLTMTSQADSFVAGLKMVKVGVTFNYNPYVPDMPGQGGGDGAPVTGVDAGQGQVVLVSTRAGVEFDITGDLRGLARLELYAPTGRVVRTIPLSGVSKRGDHAAVLWDGRDGDGTRAASGIYFYRIRGLRGTATSGRFAFVR